LRFEIFRNEVSSQAVSPGSFWIRLGSAWLTFFPLRQSLWLGKTSDRALLIQQIKKSILTNGPRELDSQALIPIRKCSKAIFELRAIQLNKAWRRKELEPLQDRHQLLNVQLQAGFFMLLGIPPTSFTGYPARTNRTKP
jgi:hypothetical protein